ncbi:uncharacterized protein LOC110031851 [Phalaenopsis equestris]|uniref:uncharacterized protein LOC110031851 n=1 Tax=Phalaenopsis equestris TaxID=78828 RepID=UPI0009E25D43|nr:uncharacterized protein LOC110031851 [Phalaenopsis equestris]
MMNGYSKIRHGSIDLTSEPNPSFFPILTVPQNSDLFFSKSENSSSHATDNLRRSRSSVSQRFSHEDQSHVFGLQAAVRRAFSMRRTSAIDSSYWRIHDGGNGFSTEEAEEGEKQRLGRKKGWRRKGGFFGLCKKFVGF